ncbi:DUF6207 family protein [Streptomyces sp. NPDC051364]|uniref:DUF6207 family protein n=1 Tax=Streptomyces sp. NPDC051364 TaxID=3155799 RepID=UPI00341D1279
MRVEPGPPANRRASTAVAAVMKPIDEQHIAEPGLVVLDITGGEEDTVRAVMARKRRPPVLFHRLSEPHQGCGLQRPPRRWRPTPPSAFGEKVPRCSAFSPEAPAVNRLKGFPGHSEMPGSVAGRIIGVFLALPALWRR